jgi:hypothetical protein
LNRVDRGLRGSQARADLPAVENFIKPRIWSFGSDSIRTEMLELRFNSEVAVKWQVRFGVNRRTSACPADNVRQVSTPRVNAVSADEVRQLDQELPKPGIFFKQRVCFVGTIVDTVGRSIPLKGRPQ